MPYQSKTDSFKSGINKIVLMTGLCTAVALTPVQHVMAQGGASVIEEITVVARKRAESLQDVPVSATVLSAANIEARGITEVMDVIRETPNVAFPDTTHGNVNLNIVIRGVSSNTRSIGFESGVGVYVDGMYLGRPSSFNQEFIDIDHVEVLRGPQGTLFGKNNLSGSINIITKKPSLDTWEVGGKFQYARFDDISENIYANVPLSDSVVVRFNAYKHNSDGYIKDTVFGDRYANEDTFGGRGQILFQVSEQLSVTVSGDYRLDDNNIALPEVVFDGGVPGFGPVIPGPFTTVNNIKPIEERELWGLGAKIEYEFDNGFTLTSISSYRSMDIFNHLENDNDPADLIELRTGEKEEHFTQEIRLASPGDERLNYVVGAYYLNQEAEVDKFGVLFPPNNINDTGKVETTSWAIFGDAQYDITSELTLGFGIRYTYEKKKLKDFAQLTSPILAGFFPSFAPVSDSQSSGNVSPVVSLSYEFSDEVTAYAKYSIGFKSGGWNVDLTSAPVSPVTDPTVLRFDDEDLSSYEIGLKTMLFDDRLRFDTAFFYMDYENQQVQSRQGVAFLINNAGTSTIWGFESDFALQATDNLSFSGGFGYLDATYDEFLNCTPAGQDCSGNRLSDAPKWTANISADWERVFPELGQFGRVSAHVDYTYRGNYFHNTPTANPVLHTPSYNNVNASLGFGPENDKWRVTVFVDNLFDELNQVGTFLETVGDPGTIGESYAPPRIWGVRLNVKFSGD